MKRCREEVVRSAFGGQSVQSEEMSEAKDPILYIPGDAGTEMVPIKVHGSRHKVSKYVLGTENIRFPPDMLTIHSIHKEI